MPSNALMVKPADIYGAVTREQDRQLRNALAQRSAADNERQTMAGIEQQQWQRDRLMQQDAAAKQQAAAEAEAAQRKAMQEQERQQLQQSYAEVQRILAAPEGQRRAVASALFDDEDRAEMAQEGIDFNTLDENGIYQLAQRLEAQVGSQLGVAPADKWEPVPGTRDGGRVIRNSRTGEEKQVVAPDNSQAVVPGMVGRVRTLSPEETRSAGFPEGSVVQEKPDGSLDVVNKREGLSAAEQKTVREAKMRIPRLNAALRRVERLGSAVTAISKNVAFDGGPLDARLLSVTKDGRELMAASAQLMPELQALTRVPGIGSQSDLETRLASLALPSLEMPPDVNRRSQAELKAFVEDLKAAYQSIVAGENPALQKPVQAAPGGWKIEEVR